MNLEEIGRLQDTIEGLWWLPKSWKSNFREILIRLGAQTALNEDLCKKNKELSESVKEFIKISNWATNQVNDIKQRLAKSEEKCARLESENKSLNDKLDNFRVGMTELAEARLTLMKANSSLIGAMKS